MAEKIIEKSLGLEAQGKRDKGRLPKQHTAKLPELNKLMQGKSNLGQGDLVICIIVEL